MKKTRGRNMHRCIFCEFAQDKTPCTKSYEDDEITTFVDWNHLDGIHIVAFPRTHIGLKDGSEKYEGVLRKLRDKASAIAEYAGMNKEFRLFTEEGEDNISQNLEHLHIHVIGTPAEV